MVKTLHDLASIGARILESGCNCAQVLHRGSEGPGNANGSSLAATGIEQLDPITATIAALSDPLEFPPLAAGVVPGDRIAIAVDESVPAVARICRGAVEAFAAAGIDREAISLVTSDRETAAACRDEFDVDAPSTPQIVVHDPGEKDNLCLVGLTKRGEPLVINRTIFEADVVLPIGCARAAGRGAFESLFPRFSNSETIDRYRTPANSVTRKNRKAQYRETEEAGWLIGVLMVVEVVPGGGDTVASVLAGAPRATADKGAELALQRWGFHADGRYGLVVATISGGAAAATWDNVGRALSAAEKLLDEGGAMAICSNMDQPPGPSLGRLIGSSDFSVVARKISREHAADSWAARQLARALQRGPVYFLSQLPAETVEDLGLAPVADIDELLRLAQRQDSCVMLDDAQFATAIAEPESHE